MYSITVSLLLTLTAVSGQLALPKNWSVCKRSDPNLNTCLRNSISAVIKELRYGNQQFQMPPLEPVRLNQIVLKQGGSQPIGITINFKNLMIHGLSRSIIDSVNADYRTLTYKFNIRTPEPFKMEGDYVSNGRILLIPINGAGKSSLIFDDFKATITLQNRLVSKGGKQYLECTNVGLQLDTSRLHLNFKRTVNVNEGLGKNLNTFLNQNWREILNDLRPAISREFGQFVKNYANSVFSKVPFDAIAPP